ncbi:MAG: VCBS domain-containing protein, partial [Methylococcales bacterium]|nr:VCBS domain-containing protein [Methylococcales bacterium]
MNRIISTVLLTVLLLNAQLSLAASPLNLTGSTTTNGVTTIKNPVVTVAATDDVATLVMDAADIATPNKVEVDIEVLANDTNAGKAVLVSTPNGRYGFIRNGANSDASAGKFTYVLDTTNPSVRALTEGQTLTETFTYQARSSVDERITKNAQLTIYILGPKIKPVAYDDTASVEVPVSVAKDGVTVKFNVKANDINAGDASLVSSPAGIYGYLDPGVNPALGDFAYKVDLNNAKINALKVGESIVETFRYRIRAPGNGLLTSEATIRITIWGSAVPVAYDDVASVEVPLDVAKTEAVVSLQVKANDINAGDASLVDSPTGKYGFLDLGSNPALGEFKYKVDLNNTAVKALKTGGSLVETFRYSIRAPGNGTLTSEANIIITIMGSTVAGIDVTAVADVATLVVDSATVNPSVTMDVLGNDINANTATLVGGSIGKYGAIDGGLTADGKLIYRVDLNNAAVQAVLRTPGAPPLTDTFSYVARAKAPNERFTSQGSITINIVAGNIIEITANPDAATLIVDSSTVNPSVTMSVLGNDINANTATLSGRSVGDYGAIDGGLTSDGKLIYRVDLNNAAVQTMLRTAGATLTDTFSYVATAKAPNERFTAQGSIRINIVAGNITAFKAVDVAETILAEEATATSATGAATAAASAAGTVTQSLKTANAGLTDTNLSYALVDSQIGKYGNVQFSSTSNSFTYTLNTGVSEIQALRNSGNTLQDIFKYRITNRYGVASEANIIINIVSKREYISNDNVEVELNDKSSQATPLNSGANMRGALKSSTDRDWFVINSDGNENIQFELCPQGFACNAQKAWVMYIFDQDKLTSAMENATVNLYLKRDDGSSVDPYDKTASYPKISQYDHMYLLNEAGKFDGALIDVIDPCFGTSSSVTIGTGTPPPGSTKNYLIAISSPLQRDGAADATKPCGSGSVILKKPGPVLEEDSAAATTTNTVGNTTSSTTSTTKKVPTTQEWIAVLPNSDDQYTFKVTRT